MPLWDKALFTVLIYSSNHFPDYSNFWLEHACVKCMNRYKADEGIQKDGIVAHLCSPVCKCAQFDCGGRVSL